MPERIFPRLFEKATPEMPFKFVVSFTGQPTALAEHWNSQSNPDWKFGSDYLHPRPSNAPAHSQAFKFNGLWFWGWNDEQK
jgi:hypothetical protein